MLNKSKTYHRMRINSNGNKNKMLNYKFRLYPTSEQEQRLVETLDGCRWVYNYFLKKLPPMSEYDMNLALTELKEQKPHGCVTTTPKCCRWWERRFCSCKKIIVCAEKEGTQGRKASALSYP